MGALDDIEQGLQEEINSRRTIENPFKHIAYVDKTLLGYEELIATDPKDVMKWGWEQFDSKMGGIFCGKIYVVGANSGVGKTTFVNQVASNVSKQGFRVVKYSLEDRMEDSSKEELYYTINRIRYKKDGGKYDRAKFICGEYNKDEQFLTYLNEATRILSDNDNIIELDKKVNVTIDDLMILITEEAKKGSKLFIVDHLHYFSMKSTSRHDIQIQETMHMINEIARRYSIAIILVAHYKKGANDYEPDTDEFKDGAAIKQVANFIIQITRDDNLTTFHLTKIRGPINKFKIETPFDIGLFEYTFDKIKTNSLQNNATF